MSLHVASVASVAGFARPPKPLLMALLLASALFLVQAASVRAQGTTATIQMAKVSQAVVLRSGPRADAPRVATLAAGTRVTVFAVRNGWSQVTNAGRQGWVISRALLVEARATAAPQRLDTTSAPTASTPAPSVVTLQGTNASTSDREVRPQETRAAESSAIQADTTTARRAAFDPSTRPLILGVRTWLIGPGVAIGASGEFMVTPQLPNFGNGSIGVSVSADYISVSQGIVDASVVPVMAMANYHVRVPGVPRLDPFVAAGLGYAVAKVSARYNNESYSATAASGVFFSGHVGARWYFTDRIAAQGGLLFGRRGGGGLGVGLSWRP